MTLRRRLAETSPAFGAVSTCYLSGPSSSNLPRMDGREVLAQIKADSSLRTIPTVILTTSEAEADIVKSYELQANCYLSKPVQLDAFESLVKSINDFWLMKAKLPQQGAV